MKNRLNPLLLLLVYTFVFTFVMPQTAVIAGGCFWGIQAVYQHTNGVTKAVSGYAGGDKKDADYQRVSSSRTGHAEAVQITFDPKVISYVKGECPAK